MSENTQETKVVGSTDTAGKYLTFALSREKYGVDILDIQEIIGVVKITKVPRCPTYLKGVINLRGKIIPVLDLRLKFGMPPLEYDRTTCIIVASIQLEDKRVEIGIVVDTVLEVVDFSADDIEMTPDYGDSVQTNFIVGLGKLPNGDKTDVVIVVNIEKILSCEEMSDLGEFAESVAEASA